jgi:CheY-like chemotaxis protein
LFWLELPLKTQKQYLDMAPAALDAKDTHSSALPTPSTRVLVVDDVPMNCDIAASFLRAAGHVVTCAEDGVQAVAAVAKTDFDVVLMDVRMPNMDGLEATRRIRALEGARGQIPIVALTAQAFTDQIAACREAGMDSHLGKPFDADSLLAVVSDAVRAMQDDSDLGLRFAAWAICRA